jgi:hypothetical protein
VRPGSPVPNGTVLVTVTQIDPSGAFTLPEKEFRPAARVAAPVAVEASLTRLAALHGRVNFSTMR